MRRGSYIDFRLGRSKKLVGYGMPRVGNQEFADFVNSHVSDLTRIDNKKDPIPTVPGRFLGFVHPGGEIHIQDSGEFVSCSGMFGLSFCDGLGVHGLTTFLRSGERVVRVH